MGVKTTRIVRFILKGDKGDDAVRYWLIPSVSSVSLKDIENGDGTPTPSSVSVRLVKQVGGDTPTTIVNAANAGLTMKYNLIQTNNIQTFPVMYTGESVVVPTNTNYTAIAFYLYSGSELIDTATIPIIYDGKQGEPGTPGQDGDDAISFEVMPRTIILKRGKSQHNIRVYVNLFKGGEHIPYNDTSQGDMLCSTLTDGSDRQITDGLTWNFKVSSGQFYYYFTYNGITDINTEIPFTITYNGQEYHENIIIKTISDGDKGERGPALRGPQAWSDCTPGYSFQSGADGEEWKDVVLYGNDYYSCVKSHAKTVGNYPGSTTDQSNGYWQLGDKIELVATKILLATYALVKNLGVEAIDMKDANGNVLFQAKDGNVTCKTGTFENVIFSGVMKKKRTEITSSNFANTFVHLEDNQYDIDFAKCGTWLDIKYLPCDILIYPSGMRALCGNTILIYNNSGYSIGISAPATTFYNGTPGSFNSFVIDSGKFATLEYKIGNVDGTEKAYFIAQKGNINTNLDT